MSRPDLLIMWGILARPFLPAGQGGLILIAGGLGMTVFALLILMVRRQPVPVAGQQAAVRGPHRGVAARAGVAPAASTAVVAHAATVKSAPARRKSFIVEAPAAVVIARAGPRSEPGAGKGMGPGVRDENLVWPEYVRAAAGRLGLHNTAVVWVDRTRCTMEIRHCGSCRRGRRGCERERRRLHRAARKLGRRAQVREASCDPSRRVCTFNIDMGARR